MRFTSLLGVLLKYEGYPPAVVVTMLLHGTLIWFLFDRDFSRTEIVDVDRPTYINATVIQQNPQALRRQEVLEQQRQANAQAERQRQQEAERQRVEQEARAAREREQREAQARADEQRRQEQAREQREREETARAQAQREEAERERRRQEQLAQEQAARQEAARQAQAAQQAEQAAAAAASEISNYTGIIRSTVEDYWQRPPSARNGMSALVRVQLVPTGEVVDARVIQSSGDAAFDRSAEQAVLRAARFPELQGMDISLFEREFRTFNLLFQPEDLLR